MIVVAIKKFLKMDVLIMKKNKFSFSERYNDFINKHPKFWFSLFYIIICSFMGIMLLVAAFCPAKDNTASADYSPPTSCPSLNNLYFYHTQDTEPQDVVAIFETLPLNQYRYVSAPGIFQPIDNQTTYSFRYIVVYKIDIGVRTSIEVYLSNTNISPITNGVPSDAIPIANTGGTVEFTNLFFIVDYSNFAADGNIRTFFNRFDHFLLSDICELGVCSPEEIQAAFDRGYTDGYNKGMNDGVQVNLNPISVFLSPVQSFLDMKIFGIFSISSALIVILFVGIALIFIKMFAGG